MNLPARVGIVVCGYLCLGALAVLSVGMFIENGWPAMELRKGLAIAFGVIAGLGLFIVPIITAAWLDEIDRRK